MKYIHCACNRTSSQKYCSNFHYIRTKVSIIRTTYSLSNQKDCNQTLFKESIIYNWISICILQLLLPLHLLLPPQWWPSFCFCSSFSLFYLEPPRGLHSIIFLYLLILVVGAFVVCWLPLVVWVCVPHDEVVPFVVVEQRALVELMEQLPF